MSRTCRRRIVKVELSTVFLCIAVSSMFSLFILVLCSGSQMKAENKPSSALWDAPPSYFGKNSSSPAYKCHHRLLVKQSDINLWEVCRDMDQGIILDAQLFKICIIMIALKSEDKGDRELIRHFNDVFGNCVIVTFDVGEGKPNVLINLADHIGKQDIELLALDVNRKNWLSFEQALAWGSVGHVRQLLLRIDMADTKDTMDDTGHIGKVLSLEKKEQLLQKLQHAGFTLTFTDYHTFKGNQARNPLSCCYYETWLKLGTENNLLQEESLKLEWQPKVQFFPDGHNETFQTPFQLQPLVVLPEGRQPNDWDGEAARLLKYLHSNQMICKQSRQMGNDVDSDGGWDICFEPKIGLNSTDCLVYSIGIGYEWSFDEAMAAYGCDVIAFDPSMKQQSHRHSKRVLFQNFGLWDRNTDTYSGKSLMSQKVDLWKVRTLEGLMAEMNHQHKRIDILKIDIEGAEWEVLYQMLERGTLQYVKQLVFEVHFWQPSPGDEKVYFQKKYSILKWLEEQGFRMWNWHWNHLALGSKLGYSHFFREPCCYELSWINTRFNNWWQFEMGVWQQS